MTSDRVMSILDAMMLEEKCRMLSGRTAWIVPGCERLGVPEWTVSDGPVGVRGREQGPGLVVPGPTALAATWNPALIEQVGRALGEEAIDRKVDLLLAPTTNLHRSPRGGRHFESYSEEPLLSSRMAVAYVRGVQSTGVGACIKHFVANDQERERGTIDVVVDARSLREIYLPPFEVAVREAGVRSVMAAYNYVNGRHACGHDELLNHVLKDEWGFDGFVVSDWWAIKETVSPATGGLDLEMPGPGAFWGDGKLLEAVERGDVPAAMVDDKVARILSFLEWRGRLPGTADHDEVSTERPAHRAIARRTATESMVMVRNRADVLPIAPTSTVAVIGMLAERTAPLGGGSAHLTPHRRPSLLSSLVDRIGDRVVGHAPGPELRRVPSAPPPQWLVGDDASRIELFAGTEFAGDPLDQVVNRTTAKTWVDIPGLREHAQRSVRLVTSLKVPESANYVAVAIGLGEVSLKVDGRAVAHTTDADMTVSFVLATARAEIWLEADRTYELCAEAIDDGQSEQLATGIDLRLAPLGPDQSTRTAEAVELAEASDIALVVAGTTSQWESEGDDRPDLDLPAGQSQLIEAVAAANPNTVVVLNCGAPMNLPWFDDVAAILLGWYPGQEGGDALTDVLLGDADPGGRMPTTWARAETDTPSFPYYPGSEGVVRYDEGVFVGYRHYDRHEIEPRIPFGHGGSYTTFEWGEPTVAGSGCDWVVEVPVANAGDRGGAEVVQVYVGPQNRVDDRPDKVLAGFSKLELGAGEAQDVAVPLAPRAFQIWDEHPGSWRVQPGVYRLSVAASAVDIRSTVLIEITEAALPTAPQGGSPP